MAADNANDLKAHSGTYAGFISLLKVAIPVIAVIAAIVVLLIAN